MRPASPEKTETDGATAMEEELKDSILEATEDTTEALTMEDTTEDTTEDQTMEDTTADITEDLITKDTTEDPTTGDLVVASIVVAKGIVRSLSSPRLFIEKFV